MELSYNVSGGDRKKLVGAMVEILHIPQKYLGVPTCAYEIGKYHIDKTGMVTGPDNRELEDALRQQGFELTESIYDRPAAETAVPKKKGIMDMIVDELNAADPDGGKWKRLHRPPTIIDNSGREHNHDGTFAPVCASEPQAEDVPDTITIEVPFTGNEDILRALLRSKATLITAALGEDGTGELPVVLEDGKAKFEWLRFGTDAHVIAAWSAFLCTAVKFSQTAKRVTARDTAVENEKFHFRAFMVRIGMNSKEHKNHRKTLLHRLRGDSAFATLESKTRWLEKHGSKNK